MRYQIRQFRPALSSDRGRFAARRTRSGPLSDPLCRFVEGAGAATERPAGCVRPRGVHRLLGWRPNPWLSDASTQRSAILDDLLTALTPSHTLGAPLPRRKARSSPASCAWRSTRPGWTPSSMHTKPTTRGSGVGELVASPTQGRWSGCYHCASAPDRGAPEAEGRCSPMIQRDHRFRAAVLEAA